MMVKKNPPFAVIQGGQEADDEQPFSLTDYLQLASLGKRSVIVSVQQDEVSGEIVVRDGEAWFAKDRSGEGEDAFRRLLVGGGLRRDLPARCRPLRAGFVPRNIHAPLESLLLDTARRWDEQGGASLAIPEDGDSHFEVFFDEGIEALLRKDYGEALAAFSAAAQLRPADLLVRANLERLAALGYGEDA